MFGFDKLQVRRPVRVHSFEQKKPEQHKIRLERAAGCWKAARLKRRKSWLCCREQHTDFALFKFENQTGPKNGIWKRM